MLKCRPAETGHNSRHRAAYIASFKVAVRVCDELAMF